MRYFLIIFFIIPIVSLAQSDISVEEIEWSLVEAINYERKDKGLKELRKEELLDAVAFSQSEYMTQNGRLTHEQDDKKKEKLADRIRFYEAPYAFAGENISMFSSSSKYTIETGKPKVVLTSPELVSKAAMYSWLKDEESRMNIFDPDFFACGVSVLVDEKSQYIVTVVMANPSYDFPMPKKAFSFQGIEPYNKEACAKLIKDFPNLPELLSTAFEVSNNQLYFEYPSLALFNEIISSSSDGIGAEIIFDDQFKCNEGNRLFPGEVTNGYLLPLSKKGKLSASNTLTEDSKVKVLLADLPEFYDPNTNEINGLIIKNGYKCETVPFNKIEFKGLRKVDIPFLFAGESLSDSTSWNDTLILDIKLDEPDELISKKVRDFESFSNSINFKSSSIIVKRNISPTSLNQLEEDIDTSFYNYLLDSTTVLMFEDKIEKEALNNRLKNTYYELDIAQLDSIATVNYLKEAAQKDNELSMFIDSLNRVQIKAIGKGSINKDLEEKEKLRLFKEALSSDNIKLATLLQRSLLENALVKSENVPEYKIDPEQNIEQLPLLNNEIVYALRLGENTYDGNPINIAFLELYLIQPNQLEISFNYLLSTLNSWGENPKSMKSIEDWEKVFLKIKSSDLPKDLLAKLELYFNLLAADYYYDKSDFSSRKKALSSIIQLEPKANLSNDEVLEIAKYFTLQDQFSMAVSIMQRRLDREDLNSAFISYFLQIAWYNPSVFSENKYLQLMRSFKERDADSFCKLFSKSKRGIQPLSNNIIKELYCSSCK